MITPVLMPQLGLEVNEGTVTAVLVNVGAEVRQDQPLIELETDKAVTDVVAPCDGIVRTIEAQQGQTVLVGAILIKLADSASEPLDGDPGDTTVQQTEPAAAVARGGGTAPATAVARGAEAVPAAADGKPRLRVAPVARRAAVELGIDLATITGTGPRGRITLYDIKALVANGDAAPGAGRVEGPVAPAAVPSQRTRAAGRTELTPTRRAIARRMTTSQSIPQYHLVREVDATHLIAEKAAHAARGAGLSASRDAGTGGAKVGINDLLVQAIAETAVRHPVLATAYVEESATEPAHLAIREEIDVGLAVATDRGLVVPVIASAHTRGLAAIASERERLVALARTGRIGLGEMSGAAITLSNLGSAGVDRFTAMVNPGESAIVAVGRTVERLVPRGRTIDIVPTLTLTLTFDHRVVDGAVGAAALAELAELLEGRMTWRP
jgi:pyruvate dehydrogenase E2 component (dihydrolipoamide acetyltransferase)